MNTLTYTHKHSSINSMTPIMVMLTLCALNIGVAMLCYLYLPMWIAIPIAISAALNVFLMVTYVINPGLAFRINMTISWYTWQGVKPVVRFVVRLFCSREAADEFVEFMDDVHDTLVGKEKN